MPLLSLAIKPWAQITIIPIRAWDGDGVVLTVLYKKVSTSASNYVLHIKETRATERIGWCKENVQCDKPFVSFPCSQKVF